MAPSNAEEEDVKLTAEEARQLEQAFKDDEFRKLMAEYVTEISDPNFKAEQEAYITQLESQNEVPLGKALVRPSSGFVVKCMYKKKREAGADKSKLFLNLVHSEQVDEPIANKLESNGNVSWSVPYAIGPIRMEHDKSASNLVPTFDCCVHPVSLRNAYSRKDFLDLVVDIAKDAAASVFKMSGDEVEMQPGFTILRGVSYKNGTPKTLMISANENGGSNDSKATPADMTISQTPSTSKDSNSHKNAKQLDHLIPKVKIVEQGVFDIAQHTTKNHAPMTQRPKQLIVHIYVEKASSATDLNLDVSKNELSMSSSMYSKLELKLPYPVNSHKGNARFDKKARALIVSLPVAA